MTEDERKEVQKKLRRVVCAANRLPDGTLLIGARHWDSHMHNQVESYKKLHGAEEKSIVGTEQGFIDQFGNFLTREEAWKIAREKQQIIHYCSSETDEDDNGMLFSENLY